MGLFDFLFKPDVPDPPPPPAPVTPDNFRDEINKVEQVRVKQPDGTYTVVQRALPLSPEEQAAKDQLDKLITDNTARLEDLTTNYNVDLIPGLRDTIKSFRDYNDNIVVGAYNARSKLEEKALARAGQDNSTSGAQTRAIRGRDFTDSQIEIGQKAQALEQDIRQKEIDNTLGLLGFATGRQDNTFARQLQSLTLGANVASTNSNLEQGRQLAIYNGGLTQQGLNYQASQAGLSNLASTVGLAVGLGAGGGWGGLKKIWN